MANERKTEQIVRFHFQKSSEVVQIEEQSSDISKIDKLLKSASKKGAGKGFPEFIITFNNNNDFLIVIECKADITKHESEDKDKFAEYAVDGALLYASFLSKEYDVLAIAASGETQQELKVSSFLHLKGERKAVKMFGDKLLPAQDYLNGYLKSPEKFRQDYNTLLDFTKALNDKFQEYKIPERERSLVLSCVLIALEDEAFKISYDKIEKPKQLAEDLVKTVSNKLENANIGNEKLSILKKQFEFIEYTSLSVVKGILKELIDDIDANINRFIKTHEYFDVLGQLYIEFLKYANSDKGLGIVLTPPHITELFADLAQVNQNSVIYDNCAGTGGFLISAMRKMIEQAEDDTTKLREIKSKQIIGTEDQAHIFALAVSNMFIHQDGKTNVIKGSCFDTGIIQQVKEQKPTVGFLNPPYQNDKKRDTNELLFVLNNLECLADGGTCVAIVPMQKALATSARSKDFFYKKELLSKHTLEAVFSMPDELFFNSDASAVTCVMVFTAHKPHIKGKKTFFGYFKDDGFIKRKIPKRHDGLGKWEKIKENWLLSYFNKEEIDGLSVIREVSATDEWCAEAYMETDYSALKQSDFEKVLLEYSSFLFANCISDIVESRAFNHNHYNLDVSTWKSFKLNAEKRGLFEITGSKTTSILELEEYGKGQFPYVTTQATNNGTADFYDYFTEIGNVLTVDSAVVGYCSYQPINFSASDHVEKLIPNFSMNKYTALFLVTIFRLEQYRYNYGRKCSQSRMKERSIKLPARDGLPDWQYMENYIKSLHYSKSI
ncbi:MAG: N-6 DNA methylase [Prevotellaceae bacterium]|jgi:16S rRNA G966 N2-methylase RsmD|nr:N-6 DNA methylase [Prevotellaceae bacterium]